MASPLLHSDKSKPIGNITDAYSLEVNAKDISALTAAAPRVLPGSTISIPYLANQDNDARLAAAQAVRGLGFEPMPHLAARRIASFAKLESFIQRAVAEAGVKRCFVIAGDPSTPLGPFADSSSLIESGVFERSGIQMVGVGGHPEGHPVMSTSDRWKVLEHKCRCIEGRGMAPLIVVQVRHLDQQAVRHSRPGSLCGSSDHPPDRSTWKGEPAFLSIRRHRSVREVGRAVLLACRA